MREISARISGPITHFTYLRCFWREICWRTGPLRLQANFMSVTGTADKLQQLPINIGEASPTLSKNLKSAVRSYEL